MTRYITSLFWNDDKMTDNDSKASTDIPEQPNLSDQSTNDVFHSVYIPRDILSLPEGDQLHVYKNKLQALEIIKKNPTGRLKTFKSNIDAENYAKNGPQDGDLNGKSAVVSDEKPSLFKGPRSQELVAFRKLIEEGDLKTVKKTAWENPRYLISSGDTPSILKEGCRYNALHIATSKSTKNAEMCKLILDTVGDPEFVGLLYGKDENNTYVDRSRILLDLYLNTPDKGLNETPLHFAVKYGLREAVKVLVSYPSCLKHLRNKHDQSPKDIICFRKFQDNEKLKQDIKMLLDDHYYVPVLRSEDSTLQPRIGDPFSPSSPPRLCIDPISPRLEVKAFAGPMSKPQAVEFKKMWKTPPRNRFATPTKLEVPQNNSFGCLTSPRAKSQDMRLQDTEKGLETIGRDLAEECSVSWMEYWPFLGGFVDLRSTEGLSMFEKYLLDRLEVLQRVDEPERKIKGKKTEKVDLEPEKQVKESRGTLNERSNGGKRLGESIDDIEALIRKLEMFSLNRSESNNDSDDASDEFCTPCDSPQLNSDVEEDPEDDSSSEDEMFDAEEGKPVFIDGEKPGKTDLLVSNALPEVIDPEIHPCIYQWRLEIKLHAAKDSCNFQTPRRRLLMTPERQPSIGVTDSTEKLAKCLNFN